MKVFLAGVPGNPEKSENNLLFKYRLLSYFDLIKIKGHYGRMRNVWKIIKYRFL